jgi:ribose transport system permease protein
MAPAFQSTPTVAASAPEQSRPQPDRPSFQRRFGGGRLADFGPLIVLIGLSLVLGLLNPSFFSFRNVVWGLANSAAIPLILAMGSTFIILMGSIDLSIEGVLCVGAMIVALLCANDSNDHDFGWWGPVLAIVACTGLGLMNGLVHVVLRIPSFMATLGLWFVGLGIGTVALGGARPRSRHPSNRL